MIQVDLDAIKNRFYSIGKGEIELTEDDDILLGELDYWQRREVLNYYNNGRHESQLKKS